MTEDQPTPLAIEPAYAVSDAIEAVNLSLDLLREIELDGLELQQLLGLHVMLINLHLSIAQLLSVSAQKASEAARELWATSYDRLDRGGA